MTTEARLYKACCVLLFVTIATAAIVITYISLSQKRPTEVFYAITVESSVYHDPYWNITLRVKQEIPLELHSIEIYCKGVKVMEKIMDSITLKEGDGLVLTNIFKGYVTSGENFTLFLRFDEYKYQQFPLALPEEETT